MTRTASTLLVLSLLSTGNVAHAQESPEDARAHFERGVQLVDQSRWSEAVRELEAARAIRTTAPLLYNLGLAYRAVGRVREALSAFREFLDRLGPSGSAARRGEVDGYITELTARLSHLHVRVAPEGAAITIDGHAAESSDLDLDPGSHRLRVAREGWQNEEQEVSLSPGEERTVSITLERARTRLHVETSTAGANIMVDGRRLGPGPIDTDVDPGEHVVEVSAAGHRTVRREVELSPGEVVRWQADLVPAGDQIIESPWLWIAIGVVLAGAGLGIGFGVGSRTEDPIVGDLGIVTGVLGER
jgi:hypothetical protein